ncbi:PH domain-containing protein [Candidatus Shapirobacteria bacterium]|nr:PH domain-containing protein [Candidatus Shapirobacteria bacterium]
MPDLYTSSPAKEAETPKREKEGKPALKAHVSPFKKIVKENLPPKWGLVINPQKIKFASQEKDEEVLLLIRRHPITNFIWMAAFVLMIFALPAARHFQWLAPLPSNFQMVIAFAWLTLALAVFWGGFLSWFFNVNIVSNERVVDIDFYNLIYREVTDAEVGKIQDVTHKMGGLFGLIFNYGDVFIQTAGAKPEIEFLRVPRPAQIAAVLRQIREEAEKMEKLNSIND